MAPTDNELQELREEVRALRDENERLLAERAEIERLRTSEAELRALVAALPDVVLVIDEEGRYLRIAPTNPALLYKPAEQLLGKKFDEVFPRPQAEEFLGYIRDALAGYIPRAEYALEIEGELRLFSAAGAALDRRTVLWVARDITYRLELDKLKSDFLAAASHELRTPLTPLRLLIQQAGRRLKSHRPIDPEIVEQMERQSDRLARLVDDLLDVSLLERGTFRLNLAMTDLRELVERTVDTMQRYGHGRPVRVDVPEEPVTLLADAKRVEHVLVHLLDNAFKYSAHGGLVEVTLEVEKASVRISVRDRGRGLTDEQMAHLFDRFYRVTEIGRTQAGFGLGLYLSREIARAHGGNISAERPPEGGSRFTFVLPRTVASRDGSLESPFVSADGS